MQVHLAIIQGSSYPEGPTQKLLVAFVSDQGPSLPISEDRDTGNVPQLDNIAHVKQLTSDN